jgi:single-strand DNA-binding protein
VLLNKNAVTKKTIMKTSNRVQLIGYVGADPTIIPCKNGNTLVVLRIATHRKKYNAESADMDARYFTTWHRIKFFDNVVTTDASIFIKGSHVMVEGQLEYGSFIDRSGHLRHCTHVRAFQVTDLDR